MSEIEKLRHRLKNVKRGTTEYRMSVVEARALLKECDILKEEPEVEEPVVDEFAVITRIIDGGLL